MNRLFFPSYIFLVLKRISKYDIFLGIYTFPPLELQPSKKFDKIQKIVALKRNSVFMILYSRKKRS